MPGDEVAVRIARVARADMPEGVDDAFVGEDAVGARQLDAQFGEWIGHGVWSSWGEVGEMKARPPFGENRASGE